jgi:hypothetical protein
MCRELLAHFRGVRSFCGTLSTVRLASGILLRGATRARGDATGDAGARSGFHAMNEHRRKRQLTDSSMTHKSPCTGTERFI